MANDTVDPVNHSDGLKLAAISMLCALGDSRGKIFVPPRLYPPSNPCLDAYIPLTLSPSSAFACACLIPEGEGAVYCFHSVVRSLDYFKRAYFEAVFPRHRDL